MEFGLIGLLGFMPLSVIHWSHRQRRKREVSPLPSPVWRGAIMAKVTLLIAVLTDSTPAL